MPLPMYMMMKAYLPFLLFSLHTYSTHVESLFSVVGPFREGSPFSLHTHAIESPWEQHAEKRREKRKVVPWPQLLSIKLISSSGDYSEWGKEEISVCRTELPFFSLSLPYITTLQWERAVEKREKERQKTDTSKRIWTGRYTIRKSDWMIYWGGHLKKERGKILYCGKVFLCPFA